MNTIKVFAATQEQIDQFTAYLDDIINRAGSNWRVEGHHTASGAIKMTWIQGVYAKDFPVVSISNHAVWKTTLPPEEVVVSWLQWPNSVDEAVDCILKQVAVEKLKMMLNDPLGMSELGRGIRNGFGLWSGNETLRRSCGAEDMDADSASAVIIEALKKRCLGSKSSGLGTTELKNAPQFILTWAFNLACETEPLLRAEFPEIGDFPSTFLFNDVLQAAIIVSAMLVLERHRGADFTDFHEAVVLKIAPSMRDRYLPAIQDLSSFLLRIERGTLSRDEIPPFTPLLVADEQKVWNSIVFWLVWSLKLAKPELEKDLKLLTTLQSSICKDAHLIISLFLREPTTS